MNDVPPGQPAPERPAKTKKSRKKLSQTARRKIAAIAALVVLSVGAGFAGGVLARNHHLSTASADAKATQQIVTSESQLINSIAKDVGPSVVSVEVTGVTNGVDFFGQQAQQEQEGAGTGIILSSDGVIMTNRHVVPKNTTKVSVTLSDGTTLDDVSVIGRTSDGDTLDVAFLKVNDKKGKTLTPAKIGDSSKIQVGDHVVAIGNALGQFQNTVTSGIISGYGRNIEASSQGTGANSESLQDLFQTDAAINEGNSGGPLVNLNGEVIGINVAIAGGAQNIGFALPINDVSGLIKSVLEQGKILRPYLGVRYVTLTDDVATELNVKTKRGAYVTSSGTQAAVISGSPAEKAGLKEGDIITKVDNTEIGESNSLTSVLGRYNVGDTVTLTVVRDGKDQTIKATLAAAPES